MNAAPAATGAACTWLIGVKRARVVGWVTITAEAATSRGDGVAGNTPAFNLNLVVGEDLFSIQAECHAHGENHHGA